jgi:hypothetical protein
MDKADFDRYISERYEDQIKWYSDKATHYKRLYQFFQWAVIILSATVPVLILIVPEEQQLITVGISVLLTIGTSGLKTFKFQENWINYRTISESLKKEKYFYDAGLDDYINCDDRMSTFVERVESLISRENSMWIMTHMRKEKDGDKEGH